MHTPLFVNSYKPRANSSFESLSFLHLHEHFAFCDKDLFYYTASAFDLHAIEFPIIILAKQYTHILHLLPRTLQWAKESLTTCGLAAIAIVNGIRAQHQPASIVDTNAAAAIDSSQFTVAKHFLLYSKTSCKDPHAPRQWPRESGQQAYRLR